MNSTSSKASLPRLGTWFSFPTFNAQVYLPFGKTRLNALGLFYFRRRFCSEIRNLLLVQKTRRIEHPYWLTLPAGRRAFVTPVKQHQSRNQ